MLDTRGRPGYRSRRPRFAKVRDVGIFDVYTWALEASA